MWMVTGATGLLGNNLVRLLLDKGETVRVLVREGSDPRPLEGLPVERIQGDLRDEAVLVAACEGAEGVFHAAAMVQIGWKALDTQWEVNVEGTRRVAKAARQQGARLCHVSSVDALGLRTRENPADEETPLGGTVECGYVRSKRAAEAVVQEEIAAGLDAVIVNPVFLVGPYDWKPSSGQMLLEVARGRGLFAPPGGNDFCHVGDAAAGAVSAMEKGRCGRRYILGGEALSYLEAWRLFADVTGARAPLGTTWAWCVNSVGRCGDLWGAITGVEPVVNSAATAMSCLPHYFSDTRAREELGYAPRPIREAVEESWAWFQARGQA